MAAHPWSSCRCASAGPKGVPSSDGSTSCSKCNRRQKRQRQRCVVRTPQVGARAKAAARSACTAHGSASARKAAQQRQRAWPYGANASAVTGTATSSTVSTAASPPAACMPWQRARRGGARQGAQRPETLAAARERCADAALQQPGRDADRMRRPLRAQGADASSGALEESRAGGVTSARRGACGVAAGESHPARSLLLWLRAAAPRGSRRRTCVVAGRRSRSAAWPPLRTPPRRAPPHHRTAV
jgi:hypothetical protein